MNLTAPEINAPAFAPEFYTARDIARALNTHKRSVQRQAQREHWPLRRNGNRIEYCPPEDIRTSLVATPPKTLKARQCFVRFADLSYSDTQRENVLLREKAVQLAEANHFQGQETALQLVCRHFAAEHPCFHISASSLRRWCAAYAAHGLDGLVEQKRGRVGRKNYARDLTEEDVLRLRANAVEYGTVKKGGGRGQLNIARAYRDLVANPTVTGPARQWLHGAAASKSYVPPSVRAAARTSQLATKLIQIGPKAAKLDGPYTECSYENCPAGHAFTADDMTANVYVWTEWPTERGFLLIRPQILATMDIGSMAWLNVRAVIRSKGQYNKDDVWGLIGDTLDEFGLFKIAVLEGGTWQSGVVVGTKTGLSDEERFGGLRALGVKVIHTHTPRGKIIEGAFNVLQHAADNCRGFCGRDERRDCPEDVRRHLNLVQAGHAHPRGLFLHLNEYVKHLSAVMNNLNHERSDGKILRGRAPVDKWAEDQPQLPRVPDSAKWMYRAAYRVLEVTRNGVRISVGSGKYQTQYTYSNPERLEAYRGFRVVAFWNDYDPDTDAVIYTLKSGKPDKFICVASRVQNLDRFGATDDQFAREATRKKLALQVAVTESRSLAPYLQRQGRAALPRSQAEQQLCPTDSGVAEQIAAAREAQEEKQREQARVQRTVRSVTVSPELEAEMDSLVASPRGEPEISEDRIKEVLGETPF